MAKHPVVVYGASGYTGMLIMDWLIDQDIPFTAVARNAGARQGDDGAARGAAGIGALRDRRGRAHRRIPDAGVPRREGGVQHGRALRQFRPDGGRGRARRPAATTSTPRASRDTCAPCASSSASSTGRRDCWCRPRSPTCTPSPKSPPSWHWKRLASMCWKRPRSAADRAAAPPASRSARPLRSSSSSARKPATCGRRSWLPHATDASITARRPQFRATGFRDALGRHLAAGLLRERRARAQLQSPSSASTTTT